MDPAAGSLDHRTQLVDAAQGHRPRLSPYVLTTIYPTCGEAVVCTVFPRPPADLDAPPVPAVDVDQVASWERANRRARSRSRRYVVHNRLRIMAVVTYRGAGLHGPDGRRQVMADMAALVRKLRADLGDFPYWFSPELHPGGHGWHCNLFLARRFPHAQLTKLWGHGNVWLKDWAQDTRVADRPFVERLRLGANYGAKYASKDWGVEMLEHRAHRYERAEGFDPQPVLAEVRSVSEGLAVARSILARPGRVWRSSELDTWAGPECATFTTGGALPLTGGRHGPPTLM